MIVVVNVVSDSGLKGFDALEAIRVEELRLQGTEEAFHGGVVVAVALA
jgi:hypothetical protein